MSNRNDALLNLPKTLTPTLALDDLDELLESRRGKVKKVGKRENGAPYWQPVKGIIRWELRQHYYDKQGVRRTCVLETRRKKPRGI